MSSALRFIRVLIFLSCLSLPFIVGAFWIGEGIYRGNKYFPLLNSKPENLVVSTILNRNGRRILPDYVAIGKIESIESPITVSIFKDQFRRLKSGDSMKVYRLNSHDPIQWLNSDKLDESKPIFNLIGFHFTWHFVAGVLIDGYLAFQFFKSKRIAQSKN